MKQKKKMSLAMQIFIALILAIVVGLLMQSHAEFAESYIKPFGTIFLNLVKFIVVPIVLFSIMCGIISMQDIKKVGVNRFEDRCILYVYNRICNHIRIDWRKSVQRNVPGRCNNRLDL